MAPTKDGSFRLFGVKGISVYVHWSWLLVAALELEYRKGAYHAPVWNVIEYLSLFLIVLLHEFGHSLACLQVGGKADQIVLWPLGGVAYVQPPPRPGAYLWSIAAGPLVNVALYFILLVVVPNSRGWAPPGTDASHFLTTIQLINKWLLIFNLLPIYPLDGGQILQSLLWFRLGRARALLVATMIGFVGVAGLGWYAYDNRSIWMGIMTAFIFMNCRNGYLAARALASVDKIPRRQGVQCPSCGAAPPVGPYWRCDACEHPFDAFDTGSQCPQCDQYFPETRCPFCGAVHHRDEFAAAKK